MVLETQGEIGRLENGEEGEGFIDGDGLNTDHGLDMASFDEDQLVAIINAKKRARKAKKKRCK